MRHGETEVCAAANLNIGLNADRKTTSDEIKMYFISETSSGANVATKSMRATVIAIVLLSCAMAQAPKYQYLRSGNEQDVTRKTQFGVALMGGGKDIDEAFQWMCAKSGGGDFLVVRATGDDDYNYNSYIAKLCHENSAATLIIPTREAAMDPKVAAIIGSAEALFIAGGDQSNRHCL